MSLSLYLLLTYIRAFEHDDEIFEMCVLQVVNGVFLKCVHHDIVSFLCVVCECVGCTVICCASFLASIYYYLSGAVVAK